MTPVPGSCCHLIIIPVKRVSAIIEFKSLMWLLYTCAAHRWARPASDEFLMRFSFFFFQSTFEDWLT